MTLAWLLYRRIEAALTPEFKVVEADQYGVLVVDDDGTEWHLTAKAEPA